jgi:hypothetical protein
VGYSDLLYQVCVLKEDSDEYCPHCDNHYVLDAKTPKASIQFESEDIRKDARYTALGLGLYEYTVQRLTNATGCLKTTESKLRKRGRYSTSRMHRTSWDEGKIRWMGRMSWR